MVNNTYIKEATPGAPRDLSAAQVKSINIQKTSEPIVFLPSETEPAKGTEERPATLLLLWLSAARTECRGRMRERGRERRSSGGGLAEPLSELCLPRPGRDPTGWETEGESRCNPEFLFITS